MLLVNVCLISPLKYRAPRTLEVLHFAYRQNVPRHYFMGPPERRAWVSQLRDERGEPLTVDARAELLAAELALRDSCQIFRSNGIRVRVR